MCSKFELFYIEFKLKRLLLLILLSAIVVSCSSSENDLDDRIDRSVNLRGLGDSAHDLLSDEDFKSINIEIVYVRGFAPDPEALEIFKKFIEKRVFKPDGISMNLRSVNTSGKAPFNLDEIVAIEGETRSLYNAGDEIAIFIYYADGSHEDDENNKIVLGSAFRNTSMVIYGKTIQEFVSRPGNPSRKTAEAAVLSHEFGHLLGLVDIGTEAQSNHVDNESGGHCTVRGCLMRASIEFGYGVIDLLDSDGIPTLDEHCIEDLQANGGR